MSSDLIVNGHVIQASSVVRLKAGQVQAAMKAAKSNGADDVFFKVGADTYVASGKSFDLGGTKAGATAYLDGKKGTVLGVDNQLNSFREGMLNPTGGVVAGGGLLYGAFTFVRNIASEWRGLGVAYAAAGLAAGVAVNLVPGLIGAFRKQDYAALKAFAE